jgi:hypothetical protein
MTDPAKSYIRHCFYCNKTFTTLDPNDRKCDACEARLSQDDPDE